ncbi:MAG TPA: type II toxin-antitoxin system VapC family toxin [Gammaproteobacteria bacterium]|nr:type II toxin-antitoxin system VapC family toxin [Gammaproteobacteria bacterium]
MRVAVDTNRYVDLCKGVAETVEVLESADVIVLPFVVLAELRAGFLLGRRQVENERSLHTLLLKDGVDVVYADDQTTHHYASVYRQLRKQGTPIPTNDVWLAALVLQHNLALHARDRHFDHLPQLVRV